MSFLDLPTNISSLGHGTYLSTPNELSSETHGLLLGSNPSTSLHREHTFSHSYLNTPSPLRRMIHSACREPILSTPLMHDQGVVWTLPQPLEMTRTYDELLHPTVRELPNLTPT